MMINRNHRWDLLCLNRLKLIVPPLIFSLLISCAAYGQEGPDSARTGIHELESNLHRWDNIRTDAAVPAFQRGKDLAIRGRLGDAAREMRKGLEKRRAKAQFNLGVLEFEQGRYKEACARFDAAYRIKRDRVCREYLLNSRRLLKIKEGRK